MRRFWSRSVSGARSRSVAPTWAAGVVAVVTTLGLGVSLAVPAQASPVAAAAPVVAAAAKPAPVVAKNDLVSARIAAKTQKRPVEVVGARTESSTTWALPNGQLRSDINPAPVRVEAKDGSWAPIDLSLVAGKGGWVPKSSPRPVTFSAGGDGPAVLFTRNGRSLSMGWDGLLPVPVITGATATYALDASRDLVLTARLEGFEQSVVLKDRPAVGETVAPVVLPLTLEGTDAVTVKGGGIAFEATMTTGKGEAKVKAGEGVFAIQAPVMYSAAKDAKTGVHTQVKDLAQKLVQDPAADVDAGLTLTPDAKFLADPATVYPVTIDPVISAVDAIGDTWVRNGDNAVHGVEDQFSAGIWGESWQNSSALIKFDDAQYAGQHVTDASLNLFNSYSGSCESNWVGVYPVSDDWDPATVVYENSPGIVDDDRQLWRQFSHGFDASCPGAVESFDMTSTVTDVAWGNLPNYGFAIYADTNGPDGRKSFCSLDVGTTGVCSDPARVPTLSVTYNSYPWEPREVAASPQVTGTNGTTYVTSLTPTLQAKIGNTDGADVSVQGQISYDPDYPGDGNAEFWFDQGAAATPGSLASVTVDTPLTTGKHYRYRVRGGVVDGAGGTDTGPWSDYTYFTVDTNPPVAPTIACTTYPANAWTASAASATCTFDTTSGGGSGYWWSLDNPSPVTFLNDTSNSGAPLTATFTPSEGQHTVYARSRDVALQSSTTTTRYTFGVGVGGILTPMNGDQTQKVVALTAQSNSARTQVTYQYRPGSDAALTWLTVPTVNVTPPGSGTPISNWLQAGTVSESVTNYSPLNWNVAATITAAGGSDGIVQVRACFTHAGTSESCSSVTEFMLLKSGYAQSSATAPVGPGTVSLTTGDFAVAASDVTVGGLSIGRMHTALTPAPASSEPDGVFGPGWLIADFGPDEGASALTLVETAENGYVTLTDPTGTESVYRRSGSEFIGTGDAANGSILVRSTTIRNPVDNSDLADYAGWQLTDSAGTVTTFLPKVTGSNTYVSKWIDGIADEDESVFVRDASGRVTKIMGAAPEGVTCTPSMVVGCRALNIVYAATTSATGTSEEAWGDYTGRVQGITYTGYDPAASAMTTTTVASYLYDSTGHLRTQWDPRISPALKKRYAYDGNGRISSFAAPGRAPWTMAYDSVGRLADVVVSDPTNGVAKQSIVYDIPISGTGAPLDLSSTQTSKWNQSTDLPFIGGAVFPASRVPAIATVGGISGVHSPSGADWVYARLSYMDISGRVVNSASYGAGAWQVTTSRYDQYANPIWQLSAENRARALAPNSDTDSYTASQPSSAMRADLLAVVSTFTTDGVDPLTTLGPAHQLHMASGAWASVRVKTSITYDEGAPSGGPYNLATTTTTTSVPLDGTPTTADDTKKVLFGYDPIDGASSTGETSGWMLRKPTNVTEVMATSPGSGDIVRKARYDDSGRLVENRMPQSTGTDAGATITTYYTSGTAATIAACRSKPQWAGSVCRTSPYAQPAGTAIPSTIVTYDRWGEVNTAVETSGSTTRTTTKTYDGAGRLSVTGVTVAPAAEGGQPLPTATTEYDPLTGDTTSITASGVSISTGYDSLGRQISYTDADGLVSSATYNVDGQIATRNDGKGVYTYTYGGTDASGATERRGLLTSLTVGMGEMPSQFTASYDGDGNMVKQVYPNGIVAAKSYDGVGVTRSLHYINRGYNWMFYDQGFDRDNHAVWSAGPIGTVHYGYDKAARLTKVLDSVLGQCVSRRYTFSENGNRTALSTGQPASDGSCQSSTTTTTSSAYDSADRAIATGYEFDGFGRATTVPSSDVASGSNLSASYFSNDMIASLIQGTNTKIFTLDPVRRLHQATDAISGTETQRIINHYSDPGDSPSWIANSTNGGSTWTWQRNVIGIDGGLAAIQNSVGGVQIQLANLHGDIVATVDDDVLAVSTNAYFEQTEYGIERSSNHVDPERYGWLGTKQRSADGVAGVVLMGARIFNPRVGRFLSVDAIVGGNDNAYSYPNNPVGATDLSGLSGSGDFHGEERKLCLKRFWECGTYAVIISLAGGLTKYYYGAQSTKDGKANAFRHIFYSAMLVLTFSFSSAIRWETAHEGTDNNVDHQVDLLNNDTGHYIATGIGWKLRIFGSLEMKAAWVVKQIQYYMRNGWYFRKCGKGAGKVCVGS